MRRQELIRLSESYVDAAFATCSQMHAVTPTWLVSLTLQSNVLADVVLRDQVEVLSQILSSASCGASGVFELVMDDVFVL